MRSLTNKEIKIANQEYKNSDLIVGGYEPVNRSLFQAGFLAGIIYAEEQAAKHDKANTVAAMDQEDER